MPIVAYDILYFYIVALLKFVINKAVDDGTLADKLIS